MKIIDLLNKIANGEEVPEKIKFGDDIYYKKIDANDGYVIDYLDDGDNSLFNFITDYKYCFIKGCLEWKIKDLEEETPEKLEEITNGGFVVIPSNHDIMNKINEIIDYLDYLKSKGE